MSEDNSFVYSSDNFHTVVLSMEDCKNNEISKTPKLEIELEGKDDNKIFKSSLELKELDKNIHKSPLKK